MPGPVVLLLIAALLAASGAGPTLHTHAYSGHEHPEHHHHGLAAHQHEVTVPHGHDDAARLQDCSPATHALEFALVSVAAPQEHDVEGAVTAGSVLDTDPRAGGWVRRVDPRVNGPPPREHASPRAPPLVALA